MADCLKYLSAEMSVSHTTAASLFRALSPRDSKEGFPLSSCYVIITFHLLFEIHFAIIHTKEEKEFTSPDEIIKLFSNSNSSFFLVCV